MATMPVTIGETTDTLEVDIPQRITDLEAEIARLREFLDMLTGVHPCYRIYSRGGRWGAKYTMTDGTVMTVEPCRNPEEAYLWVRKWKAMA